MMKINLKRVEEVEAALDVAQENCRARLKSVQDIACEALAAERELDQIRIPKSKRIGSKLVIRSDSVPNSYKFITRGTGATLIRGKNDWFLEEVRREKAPIRPNGSPIYNYLHLGEKAQEHIVNKAKTPILI